MIELIAGVVVAVAALVLVLEPMARHQSWNAGRHSLGEDDEADFTPLDESESPKIQALLALKEIEFDRATGKLSDEDYTRLKAQYAAQALTALEAEEASGAGAAVAVDVADDPAEALIQQARQSACVCPACGPRPESDAHFCSNCGRPIV